MKKTDADCLLMVVCHCPYCRAYEDIVDTIGIKESIGNDYRAENCNVKVTCKKCMKNFIVENISFNSYE